MHPTEKFLDTEVSPQKLKKNLLSSCVITIVLKHYSQDPLHVDPKLISDVNDAFLYYIYTKGAFFACNIFALITLFLFLTYIRPSIVEHFTEAENYSFETLGKVLNKSELPTNSQEAMVVLQKTSVLSWDIKRYVKEQFQKLCEENNLTPHTYMCMIPIMVVWATKEIFFIYLPKKFVSFIAILTLWLVKSDIIAAFSFLF